MRAQIFIDALHAIEQRGDLAPMIALYDDAAELTNPNEPAPLRGREGAEHFWRVYRDSFAQIESTFRQVLESERGALLEWTSTGRLATGADLRYDGVTALEWEGDRLRRFRAYFDPRDVTVAVDGTGTRPTSGT